MNTIPCPKCQKPIRPGARFCGHCGATLPELQPPASTAQPAAQTQPAAPQQRPAVQPVTPSAQPPQSASNGNPQALEASISCPNCGKANRASARHCVSCGKPLPLPLPTPPTPPRSRKPGWWMYALAGVLLLALGTAIFLLWNAIQSGSTGQEPTPTTAATLDLAAEATAEPSSQIPTTTFTPTPTATLTAQPSLTPVPTLTLTLTPTLTATATTQPLLAEDFNPDTSARFTVVGPPPRIIGQELVLNGQTLDEGITYLKTNPASNIEIRFRVKPGSGPLGFHLSAAPLPEQPVAFADQPFRMVFEAGQISLKNGYECPITRTLPEAGDLIIIRILETQRVSWQINDGTAVTDCPLNDQTLNLQGGDLLFSFTGSGTLYEFQVKAAE